MMLKTNYYWDAPEIASLWRQILLREMDFVRALLEDRQNALVARQRVHESMGPLRDRTSAQVCAAVAGLGLDADQLDGLVETEWNAAVAEANLWISGTLLRTAKRQFHEAPTPANRERVARFFDWESEDRQTFESVSRVLDELRTIVLALQHHAETVAA